jgi:hypothetical protein
MMRHAHLDAPAPIGDAMRRTLTALLITSLLVVLTAGPALAHGRGSDASNFLSTITDVPAVSGLEWRVVNADEYLQLVNTSDREVVIEGYEDEPYLRIGPDGVWRNLNSRATYVNDDRFGQTPIPADVDPTAEPRWEQVSAGSSYAWHDHRIHWMATTEPPGVSAEPGRQQLVLSWTVPFQAAGTAYRLGGDLTWVPGGSPWVWLLPALLLLSIPVAVAMIRTQPDVDAGRWPGLSRTCGVILLLLAVANLINLADDLFATPLRDGTTWTAAAQTAFFIGIALFAGWRTLQGGEGAFTALGVGAGAIFIGQGLLYISVLSSSQTASIFPGWVTRAVVAASLAQVLPLGVASVIGTRRLLPEWEDDADVAEARSAA